MTSRSEPRATIALPTDSEGRATIEGAVHGFTVALVVGREIRKMSPDAARAFGRELASLAEQCERANVTHAEQLRMPADDQGEMPI